ncbi:protein AAR2 homolog isoform X2 [Eurytemora carolleeae]|uniref:protein AAR2 homolog isoform X2 n=1 Tax=Eurytemora carolleeae TaxID=1294199 RepID=UPI000C781E52|nr:protein AAR2 homolog isoform X2 [Eurytemora carolleeae]|eukprot:XP_023348210.1 protein AAR2 homolog isoform X2 [Eurytemora affinis]
MFEEGAVLILLDVPTRTEFGIDLNSWNTGDKFMGVKMIPPGLHFIYYSAANSSSGDLSPRTGFFHWFSKGELLAFRWDSKQEILKDEVSSADCERMRGDLKNLDRNLGAYPFQSWSKWIMLTSRISKTDMERMVPERKNISSASEMLPDSDIKSTGDLPTLIPRPGTQINFTQISRQKYPDGSAAQEISKDGLDSTYELEILF